MGVHNPGPRYAHMIYVLSSMAHMASCRTGYVIDNYYPRLWFYAYRLYVSFLMAHEASIYIGCVTGVHTI
jgi:cytochrome b subunit of formate dehydrogenase